MIANLNTASKRNNTLSIIGLAALLSAAALPLATGLVTRGVPTATISTSAPSQGIDFGKLPLSFEANQGQTDPSVKYMTHASGGTMYFTPSEVVLALQSAQPASERKPSGAKRAVELASLSRSGQEASQQQTTTSVVRLQFIASNLNTVMSSGEVMPGKVNYFIGNDPSKWHSDVPTYASAHYEQLYAGIGLKYEGTGGQLKGTYTVAAGSDPSQIRWRYSGAEQVSVDGAGNLQIVVAGASANKDAQAVTVTEQMPVAWQEIDGTRTPVSAQYLVAPDQSIGFALGSYDHSYPLTIDPTLTYSTYLGGSGFDTAYDIAVDSSGSAYVTGSTSSTNFPLQDPFQPTHGSTYDAFVTKFSPTGTTLIYSTYLGGSGGAGGAGIAVDTSGNAYVTGGAGPNFPLQNPLQPTHGGGNADAFVTKLNATGSTLLYSTYLGGSGGSEQGFGIAVDTSGSAYVTGVTNSTNFPVQNPFQPTLGGAIDAFVTKFSPSGTMLLYSTYLGGSNEEQSHGIGVDGSGNACVMGSTTSTNFPTQNAFQPAFGGDHDAFVTKFSSTGTTLIYSTYLGGSAQEAAYGRIAVDAPGSAYVTGDTFSTNFPTQNAFQPTLNGFSNAFVTKFSPAGTTLIYSTYFGGSCGEAGTSIAVDASGNAYVTGDTCSTDFPLQDPFQPTRGGGWDVFVTKFNSAGSTLLYSSYLGGSDYEESIAIAVDQSGSAYVTGYTGSTNFPVQNPFQPAYGGGDWDAFVTKISGGVVGTPTATPMQPTNTRTPLPPTGTPVPATSTSVPPTATRANTSTRTATAIPPTSTATATSQPATSTSVPPTAAATHTASSTATATAISTSTSTATATSTPIPPTPCPIQFTDVPEGSTFYPFVRCLACRGILGGYADNTFRPGNDVTRGQLAKIVSNAAGWGEPVSGQTFSDVPPGSTFYEYVERAAARGVIGGYSDGTFRPGNNATRGQISKVVSNAAGWGEPVTGQTFSDVPPGSTFYEYVERMASRGVIGGYSDGTFRPGNNATRGQTAKIVSNAFFPDCQTP